MRLLPLLILAVVGWVAAAAAPGPRPQDTHPGEDLGPALMDLARRKRGSVKSSLPYSNYRPVTGIHRYRYPLYRKRSYRPQYDYEDEIMLPEVPGEAMDYDDYSPRPSLFRERNLQQQQERNKKELLLEDDGYFADEYTNDKGQLNPNRVPLRKKDYLYHMYNMPYSDLERLNYMYEMGKRDPDDLDDPYDYDLLDQVQGGRKTLMPSPTEQFYDAIDSIRNKKSMYGGSSSSLDVDGTPDHLQRLKNFLTSAAERYWRVRGAQEPAVHDPMIRKKRDTKADTTTPAATANTSDTSSPRAQPPTTVSTRSEAQLAIDRKKRAFSDYFKYEKRAQDFDDFLTREYFKSIARSVGQKKKRMAYAQFEADKRSSGMEFLENPSMLQYMQTKLKEAEEEVAADAEAELAGNGNTENLITNIVVRLDALERMREALSQLEELQEQEAHAHRKRGEAVTALRKQKQQLQVPQWRTRQQQQEQQQQQHQQHQQQQHQQQQHQQQHQQQQKQQQKQQQQQQQKQQQQQQQQQHQQEQEQEQEARRKKKSGEESRNLRRNLRRGEDELHDLFMGNTREDCPVLDRILLNCIGVSEKAGDQSRSFLDSCLRHEVCYMCGAGLAVSQHECDAVLSSSLEAACSRNLDCLSAAGTTFNLLSNDGRYDEEGICTHDPCVRQFLEAR